MASPLGAVSEALTATCNVVTALARGTEQFALAYQDVGEVTRMTSTLYKLEAKGKALAKAKELNLTVDFA